MTTHSTLDPVEAATKAVERLGIRRAADLALIAAVTMECRDNAHSAGPRSAIAALQAFGEALKAETVATAVPQPETPKARHGPS